MEKLFLLNLHVEADLLKGLLTRQEALGNLRISHLERCLHLLLYQLLYLFPRLLQLLFLFLYLPLRHLSKGDKLGVRFLDSIESLEDLFFALNVESNEEVV